jgi:hypothetical protein
LLIIGDIDHTIAFAPDVLGVSVLMFSSASCQAVERRPEDECIRMPRAPERRGAFVQIENLSEPKAPLHLLEWRRARSGFHKGTLPFRAGGKKNATLRADYSIVSRAQAPSHARFIE